MEPNPKRARIEIKLTKTELIKKYPRYGKKLMMEIILPMVLFAAAMKEREVRRKRWHGNSIPKSIQESFAIYEKSKHMVFGAVNDYRRPRDLKPASQMKITFKCPVCPHHFATKLNNVQNGRWCPYCAYKGKLCDAFKAGGRCDWCYERGIISNMSSTMKYSTDNPDDVRQHLKAANYKRLFYCTVCNHPPRDYMIYSIGCQGKGCAYCARFNSELCCDKSCTFCSRKTCVNSYIGSYWGKNDKEPWQVHLNASFKVELICAHGHEFYVTPNKVTQHHSWCPHCRNKTEAKYMNHIEEKYQLPTLRNSSAVENVIIHQYKFEDSDRRQDFFIHLSLKIPTVKELDGIQHFENVPHWNSCVLVVRANDVDKMMVCFNKGESTTRIRQHDVWLDTFDWKSYDARADAIGMGKCCIVLPDISEYNAHARDLIEAGLPEDCLVRLSLPSNPITNYTITEPFRPVSAIPF